MIGPAGAGKTTALSTWATRSPQRIAWVSLDPGDNEPSRFWSYVLAALSAVDDGPAAAPIDPQRDHSLEVAARLSNLFADREGTTTLVLDDFHFLTTNVILESLDLAVSQAPPGMRLVVAARTEPDLPSLPRNRGRAYVSDVGPALLRFTRSETAELVEAVGLSLAADQINLLHERTEGWATGISLALQALKDGRDLATQLPDLEVTGPHILEYLSSEVLGNCEPVMRRFILRTSILDRLTGDLCDAIADTTDGARRLHELAKHNLFLTPLGDGWYRYHHLFADLLRHQLEREDVDLLQDLHRRAAHWFRQAGMASEAIRHSVAGLDTGAVASIVESSPEFSCFFEGLLLTGGDRSSIQRWLEGLPNPANLDARTRLAVAWTLLSLNRLELAARWVGDLDSEDTDAVEPDVAANAAIFRSVLERLTGALSDAVTAARHGVALSPPSAATYLPALGGLGPNLYWTGELEEARELLEVVVPQMQPPRALLPLITGLGHLALVEEEEGSAAHAAELAERALALAAHYGFDGHFATSAAHLALARVARDQPQPSYALRELAVAEARARSVGEPAVLIAILLERALLLRRNGDGRAAAAAEREASIIAATGSDPAALGNVFDRFARDLGTASNPMGVIRELVEPLTERETSVLRLLRAGMTQREIGRELSISVNTAKTHTKAIYRKLGAHDRVEALVAARDLGWIS
ncbi:MAG: LuxR C-terminal-related transcriptional regulator [Nitriliruptorales bacterium]|nr:LuxR C-terminal-related transcriptional regulator [Nitriliruptorales bacterium]